MWKICNLYFIEYGQVCTACLQIKYWKNYRHYFAVVSCCLLPDVTVFSQMLQPVARCYCLLPDVATCCQMLLFVARCCSLLPDVAACCQMLLLVARCCCLLPDIAACCQMLQPVARCCYLLLPNASLPKQKHLLNILTPTLVTYYHLSINYVLHKSLHLYFILCISYHTRILINTC